MTTFFYTFQYLLIFIQKPLKLAKKSFSFFSLLLNIFNIIYIIFFQVTEAQNTVYTTLSNSSFATTPASSQTSTINANAVPLVVQSSNGVQVQNVQVQPALVQQQQQQQQSANVIQTQSVVQNNVSNVAGSGIPQMLFLNQVNINGQTSFVLVDANNKPVQLPQGKSSFCFLFLNALSFFFFLSPFCCSLLL